MGVMATDWIAENGRAMAYPEEVPAEATEFAFVVDGRNVRVREIGGRRIASSVLAGTDKVRTVVYLAGLAVGRMMKDEATLAWDEEEHALVLWQELSDGRGKMTADGGMVGKLEEFLDVLDWWMARVEGAEPAMMAPSEFIIRP